MAKMGMGGHPGRAPSAGRDPPSTVTRVLVFSARHGVRCSSTPSSPHAGADSSLPLTHTAGRGSREGTPVPHINEWPVGTPQCLVTPFISSPPAKPWGKRGLALGCWPCSAGTINHIQMGWEGTTGSDATQGLWEGLQMCFFPKKFCSLKGSLCNWQSPKYLVAVAGAHLQGRGGSG